MQNTYDLNNPKHFCFALETAYENYKDGYFDDLYVDILPLDNLSEDGFCMYEEKDYPLRNGISIMFDFAWAPTCMRYVNGELDEGYECGFKFEGNPSDLEKELRALGLISALEDRGW
jgi:hypothetical protein